MRADVRDDDGQLASGPPIEVPVEVLSVGEVRFPECDPSSCDNGLAILARQARRRLCVSTCPHRSTVAAVPVPGHSGAARLYSSWCYGATHTARRWVYLGLSVSVRNPAPSETDEAPYGPSEAADQSAVISVNTVSLSLCFSHCDCTAHLAAPPPAWGCCGVRRFSLSTDGP